MPAPDCAAICQRCARCWRVRRDDDWSTEYLDLILAVKVVDDLKEATDHIRRYGRGIPR